MDNHATDYEPERLLSIQEAGQRLGLGRTKVYDLLHRGDLRGVRIGGARRIPTSEVNGYIQRLLQEQMYGASEPEGPEHRAQTGRTSWGR